MKRQMITLAVCLSLTATSALANSTKVIPKAPAKALIPVATQIKAPETVQCPKEMAKQKFEERMAKEREDLYCKLGLSTDQRTKAEALHIKTKEGAEPLFAKFHTEKAKYHDLKAKNACPGKLEEQKLKVKEAKHAIKIQMEKSRKDFETILNKDQLDKYKAIRKEKKEQWKKHKDQHHHHNGPCCHDEEGICPAPFETEQEGQTPKCPCQTK